MKICYISASVPDKNIFINKHDGDIIIAADSGLLNLRAAGIEPDITIGDFDSLGRIPNSGKIISVSPIKDDTDTMLCVKYGLSLGFRRFIIYGGVGGRLDHTIANIQTLSYLAQHSATGLLLGDGQVITAVRNSSFSFPAGMNGCISVFCMGDTARGVTIRGLEYELDNAEITPDFPLGVSNKFTSSKAEISVTDGTLILIWHDAPANAATYFVEF